MSFSLYCFLGFQPTYEELKPGTAQVLEIVDMGFQPTYEELKQIKSQFRYILPSQVFSLPTRNWNLGKRIRRRYPQRCFQPTYEELKRLQVQFSYFLLNRFQPTYEELKHHSILESVEQELGFQPIYEELKLLSEINWTSRQRVFSLPMRNWNPDSMFRLSVTSTFSAYLWAIETHGQVVSHHRRGDQFSAYLRGIETFFQNNLHGEVS